jgi:hypothetical protein
MTEPFKAAKPRGRPRKQNGTKPIQHDVSVGNGLTADQVKKFYDGVLAIPGVLALKSNELEGLLSELTSKLPFYVVTKQTSPARPSRRRGPRPKAHMSHLIADCARAWKVATGNECEIWETYGTGNEAPVCTIARVAIQVLDGLEEPWVGSLHTQISAARQLLQIRPNS